MYIDEPVVRDAAPATKLVYVSLVWADSPLAQHEIVSRTGLNERYVRRRLDELLDSDVIEVVPTVNGDLRETKYTPCDS